MSRVPVQKDLQAQFEPLGTVCACAGDMKVPEGALEMVIQGTILFQILIIGRGLATAGELFVQDRHCHMGLLSLDQLCICSSRDLYHWRRAEISLLNSIRLLSNGAVPASDSSHLIALHSHPWVLIVVLVRRTQRFAWDYTTRQEMNVLRRLCI